MSNGTHENLLAIYNLASAADKAEGRQWYRTANDIAVNIGRIGDIGMWRAAAVIAALSPNNRWERNCQDAENLVRAWKAGGPEAARDTKVCTYGANKEKAIRILESDLDQLADYTTTLKGQKISAFFLSIVGAYNGLQDDMIPKFRVCVDGHAYGIWVGERLSMKDVPNIGVKLYKAIAGDYIRAAEEVGISPAEFQAITWCTWRRIHEV